MRRGEGEALMSTKRDDATRAAIASLLDIVQELALAYAEDTKAEPEWVNIVIEALNSHRRDLGLDEH